MSNGEVRSSNYEPTEIQIQKPSDFALFLIISYSWYKIVLTQNGEVLETPEGPNPAYATVIIHHFVWIK